MTFQKRTLQLAVVVAAGFGFAACSPQSGSGAHGAAANSVLSKQVIQRSAVTVSPISSRVGAEATELSSVKHAIVTKETVADHGQVVQRTIVDLRDDSHTVAKVQGDAAMEQFAMEGHEVAAQVVDGRIAVMTVKGDAGGVVLTFGTSEDNGTGNGGQSTGNNNGQSNGGNNSGQANGGNNSGQASQDQAKQDQPKQDQPTQDQPKQDQPKQDQPKQDQPKQDQPKQDQPKQDTGNQNQAKQSSGNNAGQSNGGTGTGTGTGTTGR